MTWISGVGSTSPPPWLKSILADCLRNKLLFLLPSFELRFSIIPDWTMISESETGTVHGPSGRQVAFVGAKLPVDEG